LICFFFFSGIPNPFIDYPHKPSAKLKVPALLCGLVRAYFSPPATLADAKIAEGKYIFFSAERAEKKKDPALVLKKSIAGHINAYIRKKL